MITTKLKTFTVDGKCPSYNKHFKINHSLRQTYLTKEAKEFKDKVFLSTPLIKEIKDDTLLITDIEVIQDWYYKNGKLKKQDVQNMDKLFIDAMCKKWGIDDSCIICSIITKIQSTTHTKAIVTVYAVDMIEKYGG